MNQIYGQRNEVELRTNTLPPTSKRTFTVLKKTDEDGGCCIQKPSIAGRHCFIYKQYQRARSLGSSYYQQSGPPQHHLSSSEASHHRLISNMTSFTLITSKWGALSFHGGEGSTCSCWVIIKSMSRQELVVRWSKLRGVWSQGYNQ